MWLNHVTESCIFKMAHCHFSSSEEQWCLKTSPRCNKSVDIGALHCVNCEHLPSLVWTCMHIPACFSPSQKLIINPGCFVLQHCNKINHVHLLMLIRCICCTLPTLLWLPPLPNSYKKAQNIGALLRTGGREENKTKKPEIPKIHVVLVVNLHTGPKSYINPVSQITVKRNTNVWVSDKQSSCETWKDDLRLSRKLSQWLVKGIWNLRGLQYMFSGREVSQGFLEDFGYFQLQDKWQG